MSLPRLHRLSREKDIKMVLHSSRSIGSPFFRLVFRKNSLSRSRFAFLLSKKVSKSAVKRNLLKRRSSEWVRKFFLNGSSGYDFALFLKEGAAGLRQKEFYKELGFIFSRIRIWINHLPLKLFYFIRNYFPRIIIFFLKQDFIVVVFFRHVQTIRFQPSVNMDF